ncbi:MbnP family protein [Pseudopedobacter saltans]|nr:MbnP family protein [Pseudopedobacter saltans]
MKRIILYTCAVLLMGLHACKKDKVEIDNTVKAPLEIEFDHIVGGKKLVLGATNYNSLNQEFTVDMLKYYVSNIKLKNTNGEEYVVPQNDSYFLIDASTKESTLVHIEIPEGDYSQLSFVLGVDSLRNTKPIDERTGVLDPAVGMYWTWFPSYIFFKMEGSSTSIPSADHKYRLHIGGFGANEKPADNNIKTITLDLTHGGAPKVRSDRKANVHLKVDLLKVLEGNYNINFATSEVNIMAPAGGTAIANNYAKMFAHDHSH